jgi:hypothetical protein
MSLVKKPITDPLLAANRANSQKSTGPQSELGKRNSSQNAGKHMVYARVCADSMKELGEDPAEFEELLNDLRRALAPRDEFEQTLVADMAELRWRRRRLLRAEAGVVAEHKRRFELDHEWEVALGGKEGGTAAELEMTDQVGLVGLPDSSRKYSAILGALKDVRERFQKRGFWWVRPDQLDTVYGKTASLAGSLLKKFLMGLPKLPEAKERALQQQVKSGDGALQKEREKVEFISQKQPEVEVRAFQQQVESGDGALQKKREKEEYFRQKLSELEARSVEEMAPQLFAILLDQQIEFFEGLDRPFRERSEQLTEPMKDAQLLPRRKDLEKIMRYEAALERQFERKLQQLVSWRREKRDGGEMEAPQGAAGGQDGGMQ